MAEKTMDKVLIRLTENDREIVQELAAREGEGFNAALRKIIREWARVNPGNRTIVVGNGGKMPEDV